MSVANVSKLQDEVTTFKMLVSEKDKQLAEFSFQLEEKSKTIQKLQQENQNLTNELGAQRETSKSFEASLLAMREQMEMMKREKNKLTEQLISSSNNDVVAQQALQEQLETLKSEKERLEADAAHQSEIWNEMAKKQKQRFLELQKQGEELRKQLDESNRQHQDTKDQLGETKKHLEDAKKRQGRAEDLNREYEAKLEFKDVSFTELQEERTQLKLAIAALTEKYSRTESELNAMSIKKEEIVSRQQLVIDELRAEFNSASEEMKSRLENVSSELIDVKEKLERVESERDGLVMYVKSLEADRDEWKRSAIEVRSEIEGWKTKCSEMEGVLSRSSSDVETLQNELKDVKTKWEELDMQAKIEAKKSQRLIKDLQSQLQRARSVSSENLVVRSHSAQVSDSRNQHVAVKKMSVPTVSSESSVVVNNNNNNQQQQIPQSPSLPSSTIAQQDIEVLAEKIAELQQKNFSFDESNKQLQMQIEELKTELANKSLIFQHFIINDLQVEGRASMDMEKYKLQRAKESGIMGRFFGGNKEGDSNAIIQSEINAKLTAVMEDTILKNLQLKDDLAVLGDEITRLAEENLRLITTLNNHNLPIPQK